MQNSVYLSIFIELNDEQDSVYAFCCSQKPLSTRDVHSDAAAAAAVVAARQPVILYRHGAAPQRLHFWKVFVYFYRKNF
jgi:hypothetical protein